MKKDDKYFGISPRIARWKIDTSFENWLSYRADSSEFWKWCYVKYYQLFDVAYYEGGLKIINRYLDQFEKCYKGLSRKFVMRDMIYCLHRFGISFQDYWIYSFVQKSLYARQSFVSDKLRYHYCDILNAPEVEALMTDKYSCYQAYKEYFKREVLGCYQMDDLEAFVVFCKLFPRFIYKPLTAHSGQGIKIVAAADIDVVKFFEDSLMLGSFVVEELIEQGAEVAAMHSECINSFRVVTFVINGRVDILGVTWRIGVGNADVDNAGAGGIYASVDPQTGIVQTEARNYKGDYYLYHPNSGVPINGYQLPEWNEAKQFIEKVATHRIGTTLISWDLAYSNKGWCLVEVNDNGDWSIIQSNKKEGKKEELYSLMDNYFNL